MRNHAYVDRAKLSPARIFKSPMDVVEANDIRPPEKLAILQAWEADERALLRAEDEGMGGGEHAHLRLLTISSNELCWTGAAACRRASRAASNAKRLRAFERQGHDALAATYQEFLRP